MFSLTDILTYVVMIGCEFASLCAMTRVGRGWPLQSLGLAALVGVAVLMERCGCLEPMPLDLWLAFFFVVCWSVIAALIFLLSRDSVGRRLFLAMVYGVYVACCSSAFHLLAYRDVDGCGRNVLGLSPDGAVAVGLAVVLVMYFVFFFWVLPQMPRDGRGLRWRTPCLTVGVVFVILYASGIWPVSVVTAPARYCVPFALASVVAWVAFPLLCRTMRDHLRNADVEHSLELMMAEVKVRRAAIDLARRLRHDQRHHRAQIAEYMLFGRHDKVFEYLKELDDEAQETPTDKLVWCGNETVNAILSGASRRAAAKEVAFAAEAHVEQEVALPDVELVAVFANLIENAVGATARGGEVRVTVRQREFGIGITVANPVPEGFALSDKGLPCAEPGVGMESVRRVIERHDGTWTYELQDGILKCQAILMTGT